MLSLIYALLALPLNTPVFATDTLACGADAAALSTQMRAIQRDPVKHALLAYEKPRLDAHFQRCYLAAAAQVNARSDKLSLVQYLLEMQYVAGNQLAYQTVKALEWPRTGEQAPAIGKQLLNMAVMARDYQWAAELSKQYQLDVVQAPALPADAFTTFGRLVLVQKDGQRQWQHFRFPQGPAIVLVTHDGCHFSNDFQQYLQTQPALAKVFAKHSIQIAPIGVRLNDNPAIYDVYQESQWPEIHRWETPAWYFYLDGQLLGSMSGWPKEGQAAELTVQLQRIGL